MIKSGMTGSVTREPAQNMPCAGHCVYGNKAPQPLNTKRGCYGQGFSGILERSRKIPVVASQNEGAKGFWWRRFPCYLEQAYFYLGSLRHQNACMPETRRRPRQHFGTCAKHKGNLRRS